MHLNHLSGQRLFFSRIGQTYKVLYLVFIVSTIFEVMLFDVIPDKFLIGYSYTFPPLNIPLEASSVIQNDQETTIYILV